MYKKIGLWGSIASIIGLVIYFIPSDETKNSQTINGDSNIIIQQDDDGTININTPPEKSHVLINKSVGTTLVTSESGLNAAHDKSKHVCMAIAGTKITLLEETADQFGMVWWQKIKIDDGKCKGKIGWVARENISLG